jgi:hypothetical protein
MNSHARLAVLAGAIVLGTAVPSIAEPQCSGAAAGRCQLARTAGLAPAAAANVSLTGLAAAKFNRDGRPDDRQRVRPLVSVTVMTRSRTAKVEAVARLMSQAGLAPAPQPAAMLYMFDGGARTARKGRPAR